MYMKNNDLNQHSPKNQENTVQAVDRAISLLEIIAESEDPVMINDLVERTNMNRTTVWRLLVTLESHDFIERNPITKEYQIGYSFSRLASGETKYDPLIRRARPSLERLMQETHETVLLSVPKHLGVLTIDQIDSPHSLRIVNFVDTVLPLHCTSNGKLLLSYLPDKEVDIFLQRPLEKLTAHTITDPHQLKEEIKIMRERGFGTSFGESDDNENGISAPILGKSNQVIGFISVSGPNFRLDKERIFKSASLVKLTAKEIEKNLRK